MSHWVVGTFIVMGCEITPTVHYSESIPKKTCSYLTTLSVGPDRVKLKPDAQQTEPPVCSVMVVEL